MSQLVLYPREYYLSVYRFLTKHTCPFPLVWRWSVVRLQVIQAESCTAHISPRVGLFAPRSAIGEWLAITLSRLLILRPFTEALHTHDLRTMVDVELAKQKASRPGSVLYMNNAKRGLVYSLRVSIELF